MSRWSRFLRRSPGHAPYMPDVEVGIRLPSPTVIVVQHEYRHSDSARSRSVGLIIQGDNVRVEVEELADAPELINDLIQAWRWSKGLETPSPPMRDAP